VYEDLESGRVASELEQSHDADDAEELQYLILLLHPGHHEVDVERQRRHKVDYVHLYTVQFQHNAFEDGALCPEMRNLSTC